MRHDSKERSPFNTPGRPHIRAFRDTNATRNDRRMPCIYVRTPIYNLRKSIPSKISIPGLHGCPVSIEKIYRRYHATSIAGVEVCSARKGSGNRL